jgi:hypothetical protein
MVMIANGAMRLADRLKPRPSPDEVRLEAAQRFVTLDQFEHREQMASDARKTMYAKLDQYQLELRN